MKAKLLAMLLTAVMIISPVLGFWHPPEENFPQCAHYGVLINNTWATPSNPYIFNETTDGFCEDFSVQVWALNVTDLFGYDFKLYWDTTYFNLVSYTVEPVWPTQFQIYPLATYDLSSPYRQAVAALPPPSVGVDGDVLLANLTFHIQNDVCWLQGLIAGWFYIGQDAEMSNSCTGHILTCDTTNAYWQFQPKEPKVYIDPPAINCSKIGTTFTITVWLKDIVKMTDFDIAMWWDGYQVINPCIADYYTALLYTTKQNVVINDAVFPSDWRSTSQVQVTSPKCGMYGSMAAASGWLEVNVVMNSSFPLINGTVWLFKVTFTQCDPWFCGAQPGYTPIDEELHTVTMENASTPIGLYGTISVKCPTLKYMVIGADTLYAGATYTFYPIPGDLDGSGHTGIEDLMIEAAYYGNIGNCDKPSGAPPNGLNWFYDLNKDGVIDIYDIVLVAKNFCRDKP